jgi:hypothetical protein
MTESKIPNFTNCDPSIKNSSLDSN